MTDKPELWVALARLTSIAIASERNAPASAGRSNRAPEVPDNSPIVISFSAGARTHSLRLAAGRPSSPELREAISDLGLQISSCLHAEHRAALLLQEAEHRHANELQLMLSILSREIAGTADAGTRETLDTLRNRFDAVVGIRPLFRHENGSGRLKSAIERLCANLHKLAAHRGIAVRCLSAGYDDVVVRRPFYAVLAINELIINALKHAFPHHGGTITVALRAEIDGEIEIVVADNGTPMPTQARRSGSGLDLISRLLANEGGHFHPPDQGKAFRIVLSSER